MYRPPRFNTNNQTVSDFISEITPHMKTFGKESNNNIITGDFNIDLLQLHQRLKFQELLDMFTTNGFLPRITLPTRFSKKNCTLNDQTYTKLADPMQKCDSAIHGTPSLTPNLKFVEKREMHYWKLQWPKKTEITEKILCL